MASGAKRTPFDPISLRGNELSNPIMTHSEEPPGIAARDPVITVKTLPLLKKRAVAIGKNQLGSFPYSLNTAYDSIKFLNPLELNMQDTDRTKEQLVAELRKLRERVSGLEQENVEICQALQEEREKAEGLAKSVSRYQALFDTMMEGWDVDTVLKSEIAERRKAEESLRDGEQRLQLALYGANLGMWDWSASGKTVFSKRSVEMLGYSPGEIEPHIRSWQKRVHPDDMRLVMKAWIAHVEGKTPFYESEHRLLSKSGHWVWVLSRGKITHRDHEGRALRAVGTFLDITAQKQAQAALITETLRFKRILDQFPYGINIVNPDFHIEYVNPIIRREFGEPGDQKCYECFHSLQEPCPWCNNNEVFQGKTVYWSLHAPDTERDYDVVNLPLYNEDGSASKLTVFKDVTERRKAEEERQKLQSALVAAGDRMALHIRQTPLAVIEFESDGVVREWNPAAERMFGYSREEALGRHWRFIAPEKNWGEIDEVWNAVTMGSGNSKSINVNCTKEGRLIVCDWLNTKLVDSKGQIIGVASFVQDITERKIAEQEREKLQNQLLQSQKMESVGRLAGGVAHDYNNMLGVIMGYTEMALSGVSPDDPLHADLQEILKAAKRSADITRQLLAFARKQTISPVVLDLNETVEGMLKMLRRLIGEDIDLAWLPRAGLWPVKMDPSQIDQILANLCVNARDALAGVGKITIETDRITLGNACCAGRTDFVPGEFVLLAVSDNGCGMEKKTLESIFDPFFTTKDVDKGTGLGLSTVYGIVKQNGGFINVYSEPGSGTTFKIYLPRAAVEVSREDRRREEKRDLMGTETILLVEDEESILNLGKAILERYGYTVLAARNPAEALRMARSHGGPVHLLITDVVMPQMNGRELKNQLQGLRPDLKCIYMSGYTANVIAHHGVLEEGINFLQKPFSVRALAEKVRDVLDA